MDEISFPPDPKGIQRRRLKIGQADPGQALQGLWCKTTKTITMTPTDNLNTVSNGNLSLSIAYMNIQGQTGLNISKQNQIQDFLNNNNIDILIY